jgi:hypothetical protein
MKQPKSGERISDMGASSSAEESHGSHSVKKKGKYQTRSLTFGFTYQHVNGEGTSTVHLLHVAFSLKVVYGLLYQRFTKDESPSLKYAGPSFRLSTVVFIF